MEKPIIVLVRYTVKQGLRETFLNKILEEGILDASRKEDGNEKYDYYFPVDSENDMCLCEMWRDQAALTAHGTQAHYLRLGELKAEYVEKVSMSKYRIETL